jgi:hypothetical protein
VTPRQLGCGLGIVAYWILALMLSAGVIMGDCDGAACLAAKNKAYTQFWIWAAGIFCVIVIGFIVAFRRERNGTDD